MIKKEILEKKRKALERLDFYQERLVKAEDTLCFYSEERMENDTQLWSQRINKKHISCTVNSDYGSSKIMFVELFSDDSLTVDEELDLRMDIIKLHIDYIQKSIDYWQKQYAETIKVEVNLG